MKKSVKRSRLLLRIMKISVVQMVLGMIFSGVTMAIDGRAQDFLNKSITISAEQIKLRAVLTIIEKQADVQFVYSSKAIKVDRKITIKANGQRLSEVLSSILNPLEISYRVVEGQIILNPVDDAPVPQKDALLIEKKLIKEEPEATAAIRIKGKVYDDKEGVLPGVSIVIKGTQQGTTTNQDGAFQLDVQDKNAVLIFSFVGYLSKEVVVGSQTSFNVTLQDDHRALEEVIVVGYGSVKKSDLTSSISKIGSEEIQNRPLPTLGEALVGQLAGVRAQSTTGLPGAELQIQIRGINTINGNSSPLYVIDGVPRDNMNDINPNDVASIQILKDASATAIYGARGGNGVVLIETKQGKGKPAISFEAVYGVQDPTKIIGMMDVKEWLAYNIYYRNENWLRQGRSMSDPMSSRPANLQIPAAWLNPDLVGTDWQKAIMVPAPFQNYQMSVSGKSDLGSIYLSGGYMDQGGILSNTYYNRMNFRLNGTLNVGKRMKVGMNLSPSFSTKDDRSAQGKENVLHHALTMSPLVPLNSATRDWGFPTGIGTVYPNPLERLRQTTSKTAVATLPVTVWAEYNVLRNLVFRSQYGYTYNGSNYEYFQPGNVTYNNGNISVGNANSSTSGNWSIQNTLTYDKVFKKHKLNLLLGQSAQKNSNQYIGVAGSGWPDENIQTLNVTTVPTLATTTKTASSIASFFGRVSYSFRDKYLLNATIRRDGSSRFGSANKWGIFPAVSGGWKLSEESFLKNANWLTLLKIRAAWGNSGNDRIGDYDYMAKLAINKTSWGNAVVGGMVPSNIENPNLKWESTTSKDIGLDISILSNRVQVNLDYYINKTNNLLFNVPIPSSTGFNSFRTNLGTIQNKGWEVDITTINSTGRIKWTTSLNLSANRNKVLEMGDITEFTSANLDAQFITRVGGPVSQYFLYRTSGLLSKEDFDAAGKAIVPILNGQLVGNVKFVDQNKDGKINTEDYVPYGNNLPDLSYGMTNRITYRKFELSILVQGQLGGDVLFLGQRQMDNGTIDINQYKRWLHSYKPDYQALYGERGSPIPTELGVDMSWDGETPYVFGTKWDNNNDQRVYDATFFRIKNIALSYTLPKLIAGMSLFKSARIYVSIDNLKTFTSYPGATPETNSFGNSTTQPGVDYGTYPLTKKYTLGLNLTF